MSAIGRDLATETNIADIRMLACGVDHRDVRPPNVLWNAEVGNLVLVDFKRSEILKQVAVLQETSPNRKRKRPYHKQEASGDGLPDILFINPTSALIRAI